MTDSLNRIRLAVVIVCYHSNAVIQPCVDALNSAIAAIPVDFKLETDLVLVANSPADNIQSVNSGGCRIICVHAASNLGFAPAVNLGLNEVPHADYVLLLNPDAQLAQDCLAVMLSVARTRSAALVGPILCDASRGPHGVSERPFHSVRREFATQLLGAERRRPPYGAQAYHNGNARCLTGACLLAEGPFLRSVGGLDTEVRMYLEDVMLCWQAHVRSRVVVLARGAVCYHALGASTEGANFESSLGLHLTLLAARVQFVRRTSGTLHAWTLRTLIAIGAIIRAALAGSSARRKHLAVLRWSLTSGSPPPWRDGPVIDSA